MSLALSLCLPAGQDTVLWLPSSLSLPALCFCCCLFIILSTQLAGSQVLSPHQRQQGSVHPAFELRVLILWFQTSFLSAWASLPIWQEDLCSEPVCSRSQTSGQLGGGLAMLARRTPSRASVHHGHLITSSWQGGDQEGSEFGAGVSSKAEGGTGRGVTSKRPALGWRVEEKGGGFESDPW